jgi:signal transduction histidine kinase
VTPTDDEIGKLGSRLNEMLARIEEAFGHERRFLADASHELRTPLAILRTELELAARRPRSREELEEVLTSAREEVDRLGQLAEDLLVVAQFDQGALPVDLRRVSAARLLEEVAGRYERQAAAHGRRVLIEAPEALDLVCDRARMGQALGNLVDNALRYGAGDVRVAAARRDGVVELHVRDTGAGFPETFIPRAFERFSRASETRAAPGTGLGLSIVQAIAQAHDGTVGVINADDGGGADVWLSLPAVDD